ncbi:MAG TPA: circularly permuted type 2 ATP-grasp protein [Dermatophilaceae bacterium]|nr:circularly permuted type 2 ATP-grasp protein [Dermatophilaceae bacterium]
MFATRQEVRPSYASIHGALRRLSPADLAARHELAASAYVDQGVTFDIGGEERPFPLDLIPRVLDVEEWHTIEKGVAQRVRALEAFLHDVYSGCEVVRDRIVPRRILTSSPHYLRAAWGITPPNGVRIHVAGIDLIRDQAGQLRVLEDNVRVPSGVSYVIKNRVAMATAFPEVFAAQNVRPVSTYPRQLLAALRAAAPAGVEDPTVVVLTPGVFNSAYFEHALLAGSMGVELVEGGDLTCRGGKVFMRTTAGLQPVDVIYRRIDDDFLDPVHFRHDSMLGCPGVLSAARAGAVTIANAVGNGVADDKLIYTYVPALIEYYLGELAILPNVSTWRLEDPAAREEVMDRLDELVLKPVDGSGGKGIVMGPAASREELDAARQRIQLDPRGWIAQPLVQLSTVPTLVDQRIEPRHVDLRPFAVNDGAKVWVLPGGLTRVALPAGEMIVNSSQGGGSKDTWVLADPDSLSRETQPAMAPSVIIPTVPPSGPHGPVDADALGARHTQQQQQQQAAGMPPAHRGRRGRRGRPGEPAC